jgi:predicted O-methyltransferase YrrM
VSLLRLFFRFLKYYFRAKTKYHIHSPFVYQLVESVLEDDRWYYAFTEWELLRHRLLSDKTKIQLTDFGAGSQVSRSKERSLSSIARYSANPAFTCRMLFRLVQHLKPKTMLELGTSLGISTGYQSAAASGARMITIEGCPNVARYAAHHFQLMKVHSVQLIQGTFETMLPQALQELNRLDYVFIDGNHRREATLRYFEQCLAWSHEQSVFVFDDIHWSADMEQAWEAIKAHPRVSLTLDIFFFGVVFFRKEHPAKEHYTLIPWSWKPWGIGLGDFLKG